MAGETSEFSLRKMPLLEHLSELRKRIVWSMAGILVAFVLTFSFYSFLFDQLARPLERHLPKGKHLVFIRLQEPFTVSIKVAIVSAILLSAPFIFYQIWLFISPGLYRKEKRLVIPFLLFSTSLFAGGCLFAYYFAFPAACAFLLSMGTPYTPQISMDEYFDLAMLVILGMGAIFQMPVIVSFLSMMRVLTPRFMIRTLRHAILIIVVVAAIISPTTDIVNLFVYACPMVVLYILSIFMSWIFTRRARKKDAAMG